MLILRASGRLVYGGDGDAVSTTEVVEQVGVVLVIPISEEQNTLDVVAAKLERLKGRNRLRDPTEFGVADEDDRSSERGVEVGLRCAGRSRRVDTAGGFDEEPARPIGRSAG